MTTPDSDQIPEPNILICETLLAGTQQEYYSYDRLLEYAKREAKKQRGNTIKVVYCNMHAGPQGQPYMKVKIFYLEESALNKIKIHLDSASNEYRKPLKGISKVHIKNYPFGNYKIYFNDSLVAKKRQRDIVEFNNFPGKFDLTLNKEGILKIHDLNLKIEIGKEYYIVFYTI